jgi:hypothetical protein
MRSLIWFSLLSAHSLFAVDPLTEAEAQAIATDAYIYSYPLVTMEMTKRVMTNAITPDNNKAPVGQLFNARTYPDASFRDVTAPNADTLYSTAWLDLSNEPQVLNLPNENGRYYLMPLLSAWTDVFSSPGTRTTGTAEASYAITGPNWTGTLPEGLKEIKSPTNLVWLLGRTYCTGTKKDYEEVHRLQDQYVIFPLSFLGKPYFPHPGTVDPSIDMTTPVRDQVDRLSVKEFLNMAAKLMSDNPPAAADAPAIARFAKIGFVPGKPFDLSAVDAKLKPAIEGASKIALKKIADHQKDSGKAVNGWIYSLKTGEYGTDYLQRAYVTAIGLGANLPQDAVYPFTDKDSQGNPLTGSNKYVIHFNKGQTPPAKGFWSITMYNDRYFFVDNPLNRYTLSPRDQLQYNDDGSLDLYIQNEQPVESKASNWLPAPKGPFILMMRVYWPEESLLNGTWSPPAVKKQ